MVSLIKCPECGKEISDKASACIYCGYPINMESKIDVLKDLVQNIFLGEWFHHIMKLIEYLDEIAKSSPDGLKAVQELLYKNGIYGIAEESIKDDVPGRKLSYEVMCIADLLIKYDAQNFLGWFIKWKSSPWDLNLGNNAIKYAKSPMKEFCEKKIYLYRVEARPIYGYDEEYCLSDESKIIAIKTVPKQYVKDNVFIQDTIIKNLNGTYNYRPSVRMELINLLPADRKSEILHGQTTSNTSKGGCYIATCVYGAYNCPEVWTLRRFRDYKLKTTWYGNLFVKIYYATSPIVVKLFGNTMYFKIFWKKILDKMVCKLNSKGFENTPYTDK